MTQIDPAFYAAGIVLPGPTSAANATGQIAVWNDTGFDAWIGTWDGTSLILPSTETETNQGVATLGAARGGFSVRDTYPNAGSDIPGVGTGIYFRGQTQFGDTTFGLITCQSETGYTQGVIYIMPRRTTGNFEPAAAFPSDGSFRLYEPPASGSNYTALICQAQAANLTYTLPAANAVGQLTNNGSGTLSWAAGSGGGDALVANPLSQFAATTSLQLKGVISDETGSDALVFANTPTLVTPVLGVATATSINKVALTAPATGSTLTIADGATLTVSASATITNGTHSGTNTGDQSRASLGIDTTDNVTFANLTISNLIVNGTTTTVNSATITVDDPLIRLADNNAADSVDIGFYGLYTSSGAKYSGLLRDASDGKYKLFTSLEEEPTTTVNVSGTGYAVATLVANLEGNITGNVTGTASGNQPVDATLTAFAALTIAANSLTIGTAADTFSQTTFAANTFPARASTGDLVAKTITDAALTVLDDTTVSAMVDTLGGASATGTGGLVRATSPTFAGRVTHVATAQAWVDDSDGATITFDLAAGNIHRVTLAGNRTLALSNATAGGQAFMLRLAQDATGSRTVTWFAGISWAGGAAPTLTTTASKADTFGFVRTGSNTYDGFVVGQNI